MTATYKNAKHLCERPAANKKIVHIVVQDGLIQAIYAENVDAEVVIYDLDTDDNDEYDAMTDALANLRRSDPNRIY